MACEKRGRWNIHSLCITAHYIQFLNTVPVKYLFCQTANEPANMRTITTMCHINSVILFSAFVNTKTWQEIDKNKPLMARWQIRIQAFSSNTMQIRIVFGKWFDRKQQQPHRVSMTTDFPLEWPWKFTKYTIYRYIILFIHIYIARYNDMEMDTSFVYSVSRLHSSLHSICLSRRREPKDRIEKKYKIEWNIRCGDIYGTRIIPIFINVYI